MLQSQGKEPLVQSFRSLVTDNANQCLPIYSTHSHVVLFGVYIASASSDLLINGFDLKELCDSRVLQCYKNSDHEYQDKLNINHQHKHFLLFPKTMAENAAGNPMLIF